MNRVEARNLNKFQGGSGDPGERICLPPGGDREVKHDFAAPPERCRLRRIRSSERPEGKRKARARDSERPGPGGKPLCPPAGEAGKYPRREYLIHWGIAGTLFLSPLLAGTVDYLSDTIIQLLIFVPGILWLATRIKERGRESIFLGLGWPLFFFSGIAVFSTFSSIYFHGSLLELLRVFSYLLLFFMVGDLAGREGVRKKFFITILLSSLLVALYGLFQYLNLSAFQTVISSKGGNLKAGMFYYLRNFRVFSTFGHPNTLAGYLGMVMIASLGSLSILGKRCAGILIPIYLLICLACFLLTLSRGGLLTLFAILTLLAIWAGKSVLAYSFFRRVSWQRRLLWSGVITLLLILSVTIFLTLLPHPPEFLKELPIFKRLLGNLKSSFPQRFPFWGASLKIMREYPLRGIGGRNFGLLYLKYRPPGASESLFAHNLYLQMGAELGIMALIAFLWIITAIGQRFFKGMKKGLNRQERIALMGFASAGLFFLVHNLIDFDWYFPGVTITFWALLGLGLSLIPQKPEIKEGNHGFNGLGGFFKELLIRVNRPNPWLENFRDFVAKGLLILLLLCIGVRIPLGCSYFYQKRGDRYVEKGELHRAIICYKKAIRWDPFAESNPAHLGHAYTLLPDKKENLLKAIAAFKKAASLNPLLSEYPEKLSSLYARSGDYEKAIKEIKRAIELYPTEIDYHLSLCELYRAISRYPDLIRESKKILGIDPHHWGGHFYAGYGYLREGRWRLAQQESNLLLESGKGQARGNLLQGEILLTRGEKKEAMSYYLNSLSLDPFQKEVYRKLNSLCRKENLWESLPVFQVSERGILRIAGVKMYGATGYAEGNSWKLHSNGALLIYAHLKQDTGIIRIRAKGEIAQNVGPELTILINGKKVTRILIKNEEWETYTLKLANLPRHALFSFAFTNHCYDKATGEDRNLIIDRIEIIPQ